MQGYQIREYNKSDYQDLLNLMVINEDYHIKLYPFDLRKTDTNYGEFFVRYILDKVNSNNGIFYVVEYKEHLIGFGACYIKEKTERSLIELGDNKVGEISRIFIKEKYRNKGIGSTLFKKMEKYLLSKGCKILKLGVAAGNHIAHDIYKKSGYKETFIDMTKKVT
ncbi:GNAT family N-acetyltransferase [Candidatus Dojkabacteria bacterium]|nr:GNAT family N-acetyltransferase [Candidatus Dojkabacteria bacterium]